MLSWSSAKCELRLLVAGGSEAAWRIRGMFCELKLDLQVLIRLTNSSFR